MAKAGLPISRRAAFTAAMALPIGAVGTPAVADPADLQFLEWERELARIEAIPTDGYSDADLDAQIDRCGALADLILETPRVSAVAAAAKVRCLLTQADTFDQWWSKPLRHVLASLPA